MAAVGGTSAMGVRGDPRINGVGCGQTSGGVLQQLGAWMSRASTASFGGVCLGVGCMTVPRCLRWWGCWLGV
jgi:hypothetical protein